MTSGAPAQRIALFLPALDGGGAERVFVELANEFAARGFDVDLVLATARGPYLPDVSEAVRIVDLRASRMLLALPKLVRYLRSERPSVMLSALDHANVAAVVASRLSASRTRCVISMRSVPSEVYRRSNSAASALLLRGMRVVYRFADAIIANSHAVAQDLAGLVRVPADRIIVIHNPLNLARVEEQAAAPVPHESLEAGGPPVVMGVGSLGPLKDFKTLVRAFSLVREGRQCRLVLLGEGGERDQLVALARDLGVERDVLLPGFVANPFAWMARAGVFVSSSVTEGCPNVLMQALALGIPIVSTNSVGGAAEILEHGRWGRLVDVGSPQQMAAAIVESLDAGRQEGLRQRAAQFSHLEIASTYLDTLLRGNASAIAG